MAAGSRGSPETGRPGRVAAASEALALGVVVLAPLPFGAVDPLWAIIGCLFLAASLAGADVSGVASAQAAWLAIIPAAGLAVAGAAFLQGSAILPPDPAWARAGALLAHDLPPRPVPVADPPWRHLGPTLLVVLAFVRAFLLAVRPAGAERLLKVVAWAGFAYALHAIGARFLDPEGLLWREKRAYLGDLTGTFVNRNTAATFFGSLAALWFVRLLRTPDGGARSVLVPLAGFGLCLAATVMTGSRAGVLLTLLVLALVGLLRLRGRTGPRRWAVGAGALLLLAELWGGGIAARIDGGGLLDGARLDTDRGIVGMIGEAPWLGIGLGGFETVFPAHRVGAATAGVWDKAHCVPLEIAAELGLPMAAVVLAAWAAVAAGLLQGRPRGRRAEAARVAGIAVGALGSLHALVDFSLQIPGYAVLFATVTAAGLAQAVTGPAVAGEPTRGPR